MIEKIEIFAFRQSIEVSDRPRVTSRFDAIMSHQFGAAVALATVNVVGGFMVTDRMLRMFRPMELLWTIFVCGTCLRFRMPTINFNSWRHSKYAISGS